MRISRSLVVVAWATIVFSCIGVSAVQSWGYQTPCGTAQGNAPFPGTNGLWLVNGASNPEEWTVYDSNLGVCWLANANLAGDPAVRAMVQPWMTLNGDGSTPKIYPDGIMDYETALNWVDALNSYNGQGWLGHHNWQLPATPQSDPTCSDLNVNNFGVLCTGSALSNLYYVGLKVHYPNSVVPDFVFLSVVTPFFTLQPGLYWTSDPGPDNTGEETFSFNNGQSGANTTRYNFFHVLPMTRKVLGTLPTRTTGAGTTGTVFWFYIGGPGEGKAVYDTITGISWTLWANLAAYDNFGVTGPTSIREHDGSVLTVPLVNSDGTVYFTAIDPSEPTGWIVSMNKMNYAGTDTWELPTLADLMTLYKDLGLKRGDVRLEMPIPQGPFLYIQSGFYWSCARDPNTSLNAPCDPNISVGTSPGANPVPLEFSFNFDDGFMGTDQNNKLFYVTVYYPAPAQ